MKIYVAHSKKIDYINDLYIPLKTINAHEIVLPHENTLENYNSRDFYKSLDLIIAEVSAPATGLGIELGWGYDDNVPIYCIYKKGTKYSSSIKTLTNNFIEYSNNQELLDIVQDIINKYEFKEI